ncbi:RNA polymerase sigma factor, partial [Jiangella anatolica]
AAGGPGPPAGSGLLGAPAGSGGAPGTPGTPVGNALVGDAEAELWAAVARLPPKQRQAVAYHHVAGLTYAEIAEIIGGTAEAARRAAADGIKNLRKTYPEEERHDGPPSR